MLWKDIYLFRRNARDKYSLYKAFLYYPNAARRLFLILIFLIFFFIIVIGARAEDRFGVLIFRKNTDREYGKTRRGAIFLNYARLNRKFDIILLMLNAKRMRGAYLRRARIC
jgi:hypothetical protein